MTNKWVYAMLEYQKNNNIIGMCVTNSYYLRNLLLHIGMKAEVKAVIACYENEERAEDYLVVHMVVETEQGILDPSYEISQHGATYFDKLHNIRDIPSSFDKKWLFSQFIKFMKLADEINKNKNTRLKSGSACDYYIAQHEFILDKEHDELITEIEKEQDEFMKVNN